MKATVSRHAHFNAAHRLHVRDWSDKKNQEFFGLCNNNNFHGHNYELIVSIKVEIDPITGYVYDMKELSDIIKSKAAYLKILYSNMSHLPTVNHLRLPN